jgi:hypothetical protein
MSGASKGGRRRERGAVRLVVGGVVAGVMAVPGIVLLIPGGDITAVCTGTTSGTTFTLTADCGEVTSPLTVPSTITTVDGGNFTISATDIGGAQFNGAVLTNASAAQTMTIQNLTISGPSTGFQVCTISTNTLVGILFQDASGSVDNVIVDHIWQQPNLSAAPSCQTGRAIVANGTGTQRTITIANNTIVRDYQKNGIEARGSVTMTVSDSTMGPPNPQEGLIAQNGLVYVSGASGTAANNTIYGSGDQQLPGPPGGGTNGTAVNLFGATNVTIDHNTITGAKTDIGIVVTSNSTGIVLSFNNVTRTAPDDPDPTGIGIAVDHPSSSATLICNTFGPPGVGWNTNIEGAVQISCTPLPDGTQGETYSADTLSVDGGVPPFTWSVAEGTLPPGLTLAPASGEITGTPTAAGTFTFPVQVEDSSSPSLTATQDQTITIAPNCADNHHHPHHRHRHHRHRHPHHRHHRHPHHCHPNEVISRP